MPYHYIGEDPVSNKWVFLDTTNGANLYFNMSAEQIRKELEELEQKASVLRSALI